MLRFYRHSQHWWWQCIRVNKCYLFLQYNSKLLAIDRQSIAIVHKQIIDKLDIARLININEQNRLIDWLTSFFSKLNESVIKWKWKKTQTHTINIKGKQHTHLRKYCFKWKQSVFIITYVHALLIGNMSVWVKVSMGQKYR